jgi:hypothetical protein
MPVSSEFVLGALFTAYLAGWSAGYVVLLFKQLFEKI